MTKGLALVVETINTCVLFLVPGRQHKVDWTWDGFGWGMHILHVLGVRAVAWVPYFFHIFFVLFSACKFCIVSESTKPSCVCKICMFQLLIGSYSFFSLTGATTELSGPRSSFSLVRPSLSYWLGADVGHLVPVVLDIGYIRFYNRGDLHCGCVASVGRRGYGRPDRRIGWLLRVHSPWYCAVRGPCIPEAVEVLNLACSICGTCIPH